MAKKKSPARKPRKPAPRAPAGRSIRDAAPPARAAAPTTSPAPQGQSALSRIPPSQPPPRGEYMPPAPDGDDRRRKIAMVAAGAVAASAIVWAFWPSRASAASLPPAPTRTPPAPTRPGGGGGGNPQTTPVGGGSSNNTTLRASERGLTSAQISSYKRILLGLGYTGIIADPAGMIGNYTRIALNAFQRAWNTENRDTSRYAQSPGLATRTPRTLTVDGVLGPQTRQALDYYSERAGWQYDASGRRVS